MKNLKLTFALLLLTLFMVGVAMVPANKYTYGKRTAVTATLSDDVNLEIEPNNISQMLVIASIDTNIVVTADDANSIPNDMLILKLTADSTNRTVDFSTNITAVDDSVLALKTKTFTFVFDGSTFVQVAEIQTD